ncbi:syndecan-3 isoform X3 [Neopsephotus bourkii]|uniref:syndecan-3 isoform X3 n=1 Tax=Neopsephotus bourkii TaxID=309878 RepID=UPI002AA5A6EA|nr:syndecan-3 isoform X3 [Neopsephotus bourkii]
MPAEEPPPAPRGLRSPAVLLLLLLGLSARGARRWRNENYERPVDLEGSGDDDPFGDDELDDIYSGSGSGYFERESGLETAVSLPTDTSIALPTTVAVLPITMVQPVATPFEPFPAEDTTPGQTTSILYIPRVTETPVIPSWKASTTSTTASISPTTMTTTTTTTTSTTTTTAATTTTTSTTTVAAAKPTTIRRFLLPFVTKAATTRATTLETPTTSSLATSTPTEVATTRLVPTSTAKPRALPKPTSSRTAEPTDKSTALPSSPATLPPTEAPQMEPGEVTTALDNELEVPVSSGPSGDFEIREEEETTRPELGNEVMAVVTPPSGPGLGKNVEPGLMDNTIDSGNSAAQLPQKNILERKEVLIAVIVGGVVGALFAAFLVMLLIYRMKKKDEGSYTLEEPKQANVTYQKPDKQEEFYA